MTAKSQDQVAWHEALSAHPVHEIVPIGDPYFLGRWHKDRANYRGYWVEAKVWTKSLIVNNNPAKFLIVGRPRSGTTLLRRLLNQVPGVHCDGEILHHAVFGPHAFLNRLAKIKRSKAYGSKLLTYQMFEVHKIADPVRFLTDLVSDGYTLIHLRRETFDQALSLSVAQCGLGYHVHANEDAKPRELALDVDRFVAQVRYNLAMLDYEDLLFSRLPHLCLQYEEALVGAEAHQRTVDRVCKEIGVPSGPVAADLVRQAARTTVTNLAVLRARVVEEGLVVDLPS